MSNPLQYTGANANSCAFGSSVTVGNLVVACVTYYYSGSPTQTANVTDTASGGSNTYTLASNETYVGGASKHYMASIYYSVVINGGAFTVTYTTSTGATTGASIAIAEFSFTGTMSLDGVNANYGLAGSSLTSNSMTTTGAADIIVGVGYSSNTGGVWGDGTGFSAWYSTVSDPTLCAEYQVGAAAGSYAATMTNSSAPAIWCCAGAAFLAGGTGTITKHCKLECMGIVRAW